MEQTDAGASDAAGDESRPLTQGGDMIMPAPLTKLFVLDTNVVLHDSSSILNFEEHDIAIPITVLEELDQFKRGSDGINFQSVDDLSCAHCVSSKRTRKNTVAVALFIHGFGPKSVIRVATTS